MRNVFQNSVFLGGTSFVGRDLHGFFWRFTDDADLTDLHGFFWGFTDGAELTDLHRFFEIGLYGLSRSKRIFFGIHGWHRFDG